MLTPRRPDCTSPSPRSTLIVLNVARANDMQDGELTRPVIPLEHREVIAIAQYAAQHHRRLLRRQSQLEHGAQAYKVDKHRLSVAAVSAISGMLGHVGIDDETMCRRIPKAERLVGLDLPEDLPAPRSARDIAVAGLVSATHGSAALRAQDGVVAHRIDILTLTASHSPSAYSPTRVRLGYGRRRDFSSHEIGALR